ncbi:hypothetical protein BH09ACT10_BH09ACT10_25830 [soil metagenome]
MRTPNVRLSILLVSLTLGAGLLGSVPAVAAPAQTGSIVGTLVNAKGKPVANVDVYSSCDYLRGDCPEEDDLDTFYDGYTTTDSQGHFELHDLAVGNLVVTIDNPRDNYVERSVDVSLASDETVTISRTLHKGGSISGTYTKQNGKPYSEAFVVVSDFYQHSYIMITRENGSYTVKGIAPGRYFVQFFNDDNNKTRYYKNTKKLIDAKTVKVKRNKTTKHISIKF